MPTNREYGLLHYPVKYVEGLRRAISEPGLKVIVADCPSSVSAAVAHRKFNAMLRGLIKFPGQDAVLEAAAKSSRISVHKFWDAKAKNVEIIVSYAERPSEVADAWFKELARKSESN